MKDGLLKNKTDYLLFAHQFLKHFKSKFKSSEDYLKRELIPNVTIDNAAQLLDSKNIKIFKHIFINQATASLLENLSKLYYDTYNESVHRVASDNAILQLTNHGECGILCGGMILELGRTGIIPLIQRITLDESLHAFVVISSQNKAIQIAIDPFFEFCCPLEEYWDNEQLIRYGSVVRSKKWTPQSTPISSQEYTCSLLEHNDKLLQVQIDRLIQLSNHPLIQEDLHFCAYAVNLKEPFDREEITPKLTAIFKKLMLKQGVNSSTIEETIKTYIPLPKVKTRIPEASDPTVITYLKREKKFTHCYAIKDDDYHVDAVIEISSNEEKETAKNLQEKTGLGRFFDNNKSTQFIINDVNELSTGQQLHKYFFN